MTARSEVVLERDVRFGRTLTAGFAAAGLMLGVFVLAYAALQGVAGLLHDQDRGVLGAWIFNLVNNPLVNVAQERFYLVMLLHLAVGLGFAFLYAGVVEPRLSGPGWVRGLLFSLGPWLLSLVVFFPLVGAGFLGLALGAGPLPILGNLVLHLFYGVSLGLVYGAAGDVLVEREGTAEDQAAEQRSLQSNPRGTAAGILVGLVLGGVVGVLAGASGPAGSELFAFPQGWLVATAVLAGGALGALAGALMSLPTGGARPRIGTWRTPV